jgi:ABC-type uncharacterized transport system permease subunit
MQLGYKEVTRIRILAIAGAMAGLGGTMCAGAQWTSGTSPQGPGWITLVWFWLETISAPV